MKYYCNPINYSYKYQFNKQSHGPITVSREGADPSLVCFRGKFLLFPSMTCGFLHSKTKNGKFLFWNRSMAMGMKLQNAPKRRMNRIIQQNFIEMLQQMPFEQITVKELCEKADINRATFYRYYADLYALKEEVSNELFDLMFTKVVQKGMASPGDTRSTILEYALEALTVVQEHHVLCRVLICDDGNNAFAYRLSDAFTKLFNESEREQFVRVQQAELLVHFMASGVIGVLRNWLNTGCAVDREEVARIIDQAIMSTYYQLEEYKV